MKTHPSSRLIAVAAVVLYLTQALFAESGVTLVDNIGKQVKSPRFNPIFPRALTWSGAMEIMNRQEIRGPWVQTLEESLEAPDLYSVVLNSDVIALYGKPGARNMGLLGQHPIEKLDEVMKDFVESYDAANGARGIIPALYIIYGTCWPGGDIGILPDATVRKYVEYAAERGWYVFLDHQIGRFTVEAAMQKLLPYLKYPNVHLALDPEWRTDKPMKEIGYVTAAELNRAQETMQEWMIEHGIPGRRMLVVHQFKPKMISSRHEVRSDYPLIELIHCADGFGSPSLKKNTYAMNAEAKNIPLKSFKLFLKPTIEGAGWDQPIMSPQDVFALNPRPYLIMYQ
jgi:hypothetical protein